MRDLRELNVNQGGEPVATPPPTHQQFQDLEQLVGAPLPESYKAFLRFSNGGHPELDSFPVAEWDGYNASVNKFFRLTDDPTDVGSLRWIYAYRPKPTLLPIARDGGDNLLCLSVAPSDYGAVYFWTHDEPDAEAGRVADSFEEFLDLLYLDPDDL